MYSVELSEEVNSQINAAAYMQPILEALCKIIGSRPETLVAEVAVLVKQDTLDTEIVRCAEKLVAFWDDMDAEIIYVDPETALVKAVRAKGEANVS